MKKTWNIINDLTGNGRPIKEIKKLLINENQITDERELSEAFVEHFCSIADNLDDCLPRSDFSPLTYMNASSTRSFFLFPVTETECIKLISTLKLTKTNIHHIPVKIFISLKNYFAYPLTKLINHSFQTGTFPNDLKIARITPIFKKGDKSNPGNYPPIASLPFVSKFIERCLEKENFIF